MKNILLTRTQTGDEGTFGTLHVGKNAFCITGELPKYAGNPSIENERCADCIPVGTYSCKLIGSPKFGRVYEVTDVPNRSAILIHAGNFCGNINKGMKSHVLGCILLGQSLGVLDGQKAVLNSKSTLASFMNLIAGEPFILTIEEAYD